MNFQSKFMNSLTLIILDRNRIIGTCYNIFSDDLSGTIRYNNTAQIQRHRRRHLILHRINSALTS